MKSYKEYGKEFMRPELPDSKFFVRYGKSNMMAFCPDPIKKGNRPPSVWPESSWKGTRWVIIAAVAAAEWEMLFPMYAILRDETAKTQRKIWMEIYKDAVCEVKGKLS